MVKLGKVIIEKLDCFGRHGVLKEENILGQRFFVTCIMATDFDSAAETDNINKAVNYANVSQFITSYVKENIFKLIETLSSKLADEILVNFNVNSVTIKIEKPSAPVGLPLKTVAVEVTKKWEKSYLSIGSNMGDKKAYLDFAVSSLKNDKNIKVIKVSSYIETAPYGYTDQDTFLNGCIEIETIYSPHKLLKAINTIESNADRKREIHWGPRTLDIDIVLYGDKIINDEKLTIPHIDMENRLFVLSPLNEIAPYAIDPLNRRTVREMLKALETI
ncbi:MAG: 2-amino-4-hydroxy-6-hydroxymethyldihydropteridine diphosphokinase [Clostridia bacterium]|nr:2-amino-4-hydroxy-6-hydroxymethyldihydropteridine diphosphokinase [Clostridia bacterium]